MAASAALFFIAALRPAPLSHAARPDGEPGARKTVFDLSHGEIFSPVKDGPLNYSSFYGMIKSSGQDVSVTYEKATKPELEGVKTYIIAGPSRSFSEQEQGVLRDFVKDGGNLLVLMHISRPVAMLTKSFGIIVSNFVISEASDLISNESQDFYVSRFAAHPVTSGLKKIAVFGTWGLMAEGNASVVASTSGKSWADINRDRKFDSGEPVQQFGIIGISGFGKGKVVVVADDAPFANKFIEEADNRRLSENIIKWFMR